MDLTLEQVREDQKSVLSHLLEKYLYEFSQWIPCSVGEDGLYGYPWLDAYWKEPGRCAYFFRVDGELAGFAMMHQIPISFRKTDHVLAEFCIFPKFRRQGIGTEAAILLFQKHPGTWQLQYTPKNAGAAKFWNRLMKLYAGSGYRKIEGDPRAAYADGTPGVVLYFTSAPLPADEADAE